MTISPKKIVIIGAGAGGFELATSLGKKLGRTKQATVTLVDRNHSHIWKPLLHELAAGSIDEGVEAISYMDHASKHAFQFQLGYMSNINRETKQVFLDEIYDITGELLVPTRYIFYDILIIALGSVSNSFGTIGVDDNCIFLDSPSQAKYFHTKMLNLFLRGFSQSNIEEKVSIAIVGGGATGVELSAELHNTVQKLHSYGFNNLSNQSLHITLIEAGERILPTLPPRISAASHKALTKLGIRVLTKTMITRVDAGGLYTKDGEYLQAKLMVWAAGIKAPDFMKDFGGLETNHINQLIVKPTLQTTRDSNVFAIGDCASCAIPTGGVVPPRAQAAHQMASCVYYNILALLHRQNLKTYVYKDYGSLVSMSHFSTVGILMGNLIRFSMMIEGRIARIAYISLYRMHQIALHGYIKTGLIILVGRINRIIRPYLKLY